MKKIGKHTHTLAQGRTYTKIKEYSFKLNKFTHISLLLYIKAMD